MTKGVGTNFCYFGVRGKVCYSVEVCDGSMVLLSTAHKTMYWSGGSAELNFAVAQRRFSVGGLLKAFP